MSQQHVPVRRAGRRAGRRACLAVVAIALFPGVAAAQLNPTGGTVTKGKSEAPRFYGLSMDYSLWANTSINTVNYTLSFDHYFSPVWSFGRLFFRDTRWERLGLSARLNISHAAFSNDETFYSVDANQGAPTPCSNLTPSGQGGTIDPTLVERCPKNGPDRTNVGDVWIFLRNPAIYTIPKANIVISPSLRLTLPTSAQSRFATMQAALQPAVALSRSFLDGKIGLAYSVGVNKFFHEHPVSVVGDRTDPASAYGQTFVPLRQQCEVSQLGAAARALDPSQNTLGCSGVNPDYTLLNTFSLSVNPHEKISLMAFYALIDTYARSVKNELGCLMEINGQTVDVCASTDTVAANSGTRVFDVGHRPLQWWWMSISYQPLDWLGLSLNWITFSMRIFPDGTPRQPFIGWNYEALTQVSLGLSFQVDALAKKILPKAL